MNPAISVIIRTRNESKYLGRVLKRLKEQQHNGSVEIIVVDSGSTDNTVSIAEEFGCRLIRMKKEEFSFGRALNVGIEQAKGEIIVCLSGHSVPVTTDYFNLMITPFRDSDIAATFGRDVPWPEACPSQARDILNHFPAKDLDGNKFSNANAAIRKEIWQTVRFDEDLAASEDLLWAKQVMNLGYKIQYVPDAAVFHSHSPSLSYINKRAFIESRSTNAFAEIKYSFGISKMVRFFIGHWIRDTIFAIRKRYSIFWLFHIPLYRFSQSIGLFAGYKKGEHLRLDVLSRVGQYSFMKEDPEDIKKVMIVTHCFLPESIGGTEYYTLNLAKELIKKGWKVKVVSAMRDLTQKRYKVIEGRYEGIDVIKIINSPEFCTQFIEYFIDHNIDNVFRAILKTEKPDVVHFQHTAYLSARLPEVAHQLNIPCIFTLHDYWYMCYRSQLIRPAEGLCPGTSDGIYCATCFDTENPHIAGTPSFPILNKFLQTAVVRRSNIKAWLSPRLKQTIKKVLYKKPRIKNPLTKESTYHYPNPELWSILEHSFRIGFMKKQLLYPAVVVSPSMYLKKRYEKEGFREIMYVPHGFEPQQKIVNPPFNGKLILGYLSNIIPFKGADVILKELKHVRYKQRVELLFYGKVLDDIYQKKLEILANEYPDVKISFMGPYRGKDELKRVLSNIHAVVFPSLWEENHPLIIREALLYGVPVISSSLGGAPEAIEDGVNGFVFNPYKEGDFAEKINLILEKPEILRKITEGARITKIESMGNHVEKIIEFYNSTTGLSTEIQQ